ncbi:hypothetical protein NVP1250O_61 [Vibrio phage 1.250.O._10N.261.55.E11]|nr:hypothetical protein NVP1250O_61 [Vibrio phage 1.250.O._10N.261.55.E11]
MEDVIKWYTERGCTHVQTLGFVKMPDGYALMINSDYTHYFWVREDWAESSITCDRWDAYRGALRDSKERTSCN